MYTKGLVLRIEVPIQFILYHVTSNSHEECYNAHIYIHACIAVISRIQAHVDFQPWCAWFTNLILLYVLYSYSALLELNFRKTMIVKSTS